MTDANCLICRRQQSADPATVFENELWLARHSQETNILGYLILEPKRHFLDLAESTDEESASFGKVMRQLVASVKKVVKPERVYTFTLAEVVPHFHVHIVPRAEALPRAFRGRGILSYPLQPAASQALVESTCNSLKSRLLAVRLLT
jgi:diadenosine tetraphosphate (Ap4A) HIT family hydrolase